MTAPMARPRPVKLPEKKVLEKDIEAAVCQYATHRGIYVRKFSTPNYRASPDRIFIIPPSGYLFFIEFKAAGNTWTKPQARERDRLKAAGARVFLCDDIAQGFGIIDQERVLSGAPE